MTRPVGRVAIVGRDAAAWLTALALQRAVGRIGVTVTVVDLPTALDKADVYSAVPSLGALHALLGLSEIGVLDGARGLPVLAQRFANWSRARPPFMHGYDTQRPAIRDIDFLQFWVKARGEGLKVELEDFSIAAAAAKQGRTAVERDGGPGSQTIAPGYHLDALGYVDAVRRAALACGVHRIAGGLAAVSRDQDRIASVTLTDGQVIEADLFIDASGVEAALIGGFPGSAFEAWTDGFDSDRLLVASAAALKPLPAFSQIAAFRAGWLGLYPLRDRTAIVAVYDSGMQSDREVLEAIPVLSGLAIQGEAAVAPLTVGARPAWRGNCVAIGEAAVVLEPLDAVQLHVIHMGITHLVGLFPADADAMPEAEVFNRGFDAHVRNVRDFQLAHYHLNQRFDEPFWDRARKSPVSPDLKARLDLFSARGRVLLFEDESFQEQNWASIFVGHGLMPRSYDPFVDAVPADEQMGKVRSLLTLVADEVRSMPALDAHFGAAAGRRPS
ncbi:MAG: tryptophan 7-halogenase [Brevundimonas sp.]